MAETTPSLICKLSEPGLITWYSEGRNLTTIRDSDYSTPKGRIDLRKAKRSDTGNYTCTAKTNGGDVLEKTVFVRIIGKICYLIFHEKG